MLKSGLEICEYSNNDHSEVYPLDEFVGKSKEASATTGDKFKDILCVVNKGGMWFSFVLFDSHILQ